MKIHIIAPALPPELNGIGDYTAQLAVELAKGATIRVLTAEEGQRAPLSGVAIESCFSVEQTRSFWRLASVIEADRPDWLLLQYNPFSYGRWGLNLHLPLVVRSVKRKCRGTRFALMVHEPFLPVTSWKYAIMTIWQRWQLWLLGKNADVVFCSIEAWATRFTPWFPRTPVVHLPVGSNISYLGMARDAARARLGIDEHTVVMGLFGTAHISRLLDWARSAAEAVRQTGANVFVLYMGPDGPTVREKLGDIPVHAEGPLPGEEVSRRFSALDVYLAPFMDGVSSRRTSLMTGLQHGIATVGTRGPLTDRMLLKEDGRAFLLADVSSPTEFDAQVQRLVEDARLRVQLGCEGRRLYQREFTWERIGSRLLAALEAGAARNIRAAKGAAYQIHEST